ncbi:MAG: alkaline phosphatase family protein, partial [Phycisphaerales bacterium]
MSGKEDKSPQADPAAGQVHPPDDPPGGRKVLIIGLDGATWNVLKPVMGEGHMPHLKRVVDTGVSGVLHSTIPPITPAAWTTFLTGKNPGRHGIIDFESYNPKTNKLEFNSTLGLRNLR